MQQWRIGAVTITKVVESEGPMPASFLFDKPDVARIAAHAGWLAPHFIKSPDLFLGSVHADADGRTLDG